MTQRVLLAAGWYFPQSNGGTEVYVRGLARHLRRRGVEVAVAAPTPDPAVESYVHEGVPVFRYPSTASWHGFDGRAPASREWSDILDRFAPTTVDLHSMVPDLGLPHLRAAAARGARAVVTIHLPELLCARGTFMRFGATPCDGDLARQPCTACRLDARGVPAPAAALLARIPADLERRLRRWPVPGLLKRMAAAPAADADRRAWLAELAASADCFVAVSEWLAATLMKNGVPAEKVVVCPHGVDAPDRASRRDGAVRGGPLRVGFAGRTELRKGLHVLVDAVRRIDRRTPIELHIWPLARTRDAQRFRDRTVRKARSDDRIVFHDETASPPEIYERIDVLAVPSIGFETGPFVILEAHAAGVPVVGSNLGGIAERVIDGRNGLLVPAGDAAALAHALTRLAREPQLLDRLRPSGPHRSMADVAAETAALYERLDRPSAA